MQLFKHFDHFTNVFAFVINLPSGVDAVMPKLLQLDGSFS
jgi:hypothetical protein